MPAMRQKALARKALAVTFLLSVMFAIPGRTLGNVPAQWNEKSALRYSQAAIGRTVRNHKFRDTRSQSVSMQDFRGRPLVINLIYTSCYHTCPIIIQTLARSVAVARDALGANSFSVVTIGFDSQSDTPSRMRAYGKSQGIDFANWRFLSADESTINALAQDLGFVFYPSPRGFDHLAQTTIVDENGVVFGQVYGAKFEPPAIVGPLKALVFGRKGNLVTIDGLLNRIKLFCTIYDPANEHYRFDYSIFVGGTIGLACLILLAVVLIREWRRGRVTRRNA